MKTKIVEHIASEALHALREAQGEVENMRAQYPDVLSETKSRGIGLDFAVLRSKLNQATDLVELLV